MGETLKQGVTKIRQSLLGIRPKKTYEFVCDKKKIIIKKNCAYGIKKGHVKNSNLMSKALIYKRKRH